MYHYNAGDMLTVPVTSDCMRAIKEQILLPAVSLLSDAIIVETFSKKVLIGLIIVMNHYSGMCILSQWAKGRYGKNDKWNKEVDLNVNESLTDGQAHGWIIVSSKRLCIG